MSWRISSVGGSCKGDPSNHKHNWSNWEKIGEQRGWLIIGRECMVPACEEIETSKLQITEKTDGQKETCLQKNHRNNV